MSALPGQREADEVQQFMRKTCQNSAREEKDGECECTRHFHWQDLWIFRGLSLEDSCWESGHMLTDMPHNVNQEHSENAIQVTGCSEQEGAEWLWQMVTAGYPAGSHRWALGAGHGQKQHHEDSPETNVCKGNAWKQRLCSISRSHHRDTRSLLWRLPFSKAEPGGTILKGWQGWQENHFYLPRRKKNHFPTWLRSCLWQDGCVPSLAHAWHSIHSCETE